MILCTYLCIVTFRCYKGHKVPNLFWTCSNHKKVESPYFKIIKYAISWPKLGPDVFTKIRLRFFMTHALCLLKFVQRGMEWKRKSWGSIHKWRHYFHIINSETLCIPFLTKGDIGDFLMTSMTIMKITTYGAMQNICDSYWL